MDDLQCYDTEELKAELQRREEEEKRADKPTPMENPDWSALINVCQENIDAIFNTGYQAKDIRYWYWCYEAAMIAVFGSNVFEWINANANA